MASSDYIAYAPGVTFVDDIGGAGGTPLSAANFNGLRADLTTYIQNHINGLKQDGTAGNNHATADILDYNNGVVVLPESTAYANTTGGGSGVGGMYTQSVRNDMFANLFRIILGGTGSLTARIATFNGNSGNDLNSMYALLHGSLTAVGLAAPVLATNLIADYKPTTSLTAGEIVVGAGGGTTDSSGNVTGGIALQHAPLTNAVSAAQPSGVQAQYVVISLAPGTFAPVATGGVVAATAGAAVPPVYPTANKPVALVLWRGATSNPSNVIAPGDIIDLRNLGGGGGGAGGSGTDSGVRASALLINGTNGIFSGALDVTNAATALDINPALVHVAGQAPPTNVLRNMAQVDLLSRLTSPTGSIIQLLASAAAIQPGPFSADIGGARYTATTTLSADASTLAASQQVKLCLDITSGALALTFLGAATNPNFATQQVIQQYQLDSAKNLLPTPAANGPTVTFTPWPDNTPLGMIDSTQVRRRKIEIADNGAGVPAFVPAASFATIAGVPSGTFALPARCQGMVYARIWGTKTGGANPVYIAPLIDGGPVDAAAFYELNTAATGDFTIFMAFEIPPLNPLATHTIGLGFEHGGVGTDTIALYANGTKVWAIFDGI